MTIAQAAERLEVSIDELVGYIRVFRYFDQCPGGFDEANITDWNLMWFEAQFPDVLVWSSRKEPVSA